MSQIERITVIAPMRNEVGHVDDIVADLARQDFDGEVEVLVSDGGSTDGSVERLRTAADNAGLDLRVLPNPAGWVSSGLNACIAAAHGDLLVRIDCHSHYPADYLSLCARASEETGALNVGGRCIPRGQTRMQRAIACGMSSPFGGIGWTRVAAAGRRVEVDTVTYGAFRPQAFAIAGSFDETLLRNQDDEFNLRLRRAGGEVVFDPRIIVFYSPRASLAELWHQYYQYGYWKVPVMLKHRQVLTARSVAPIALVTSLAALGCTSAASKTGRILLVTEITCYAMAGIGFAAHSVRRRHEPTSLLPLVVAAFPAFHFGYGLGMAHGWLNAAIGRIRPGDLPDSLKASSKRFLSDAPASPSAE
jgi:GT2 family glycosyltransferase